MYPMTDTEAMDALRRGDSEGMGALVARYQTRALRLAYQITRDRAMAEDLVADAFLVVFRHAGRQDSSRPFEPWFLRIVANRAISYARRRARFQRLAHLLQGDDRSEAPDEVADRRDIGREVADALKRIPPAERAALSLRYVMDLDERSVAEIMQKPIGTVKTLLHRGRHRLQRQLLAAGGEIAAMSTTGGKL
jgi:RNA polymerase sigma-70 factor (ECF subfamily)